MKEENTKTMSSSRSYGSSQVITNILLLLVLAAISAFGIDQRLHAQDGRERAERMYELMRSHVGHVWTEDLKKEGRRYLFANYFAEQVLKNKDYSKKDLKELLAQGAAGIDSYISLNEAELILAIKESAMGELYGWQVLMSNVKYGSEIKNQTSINSTTKGEEK
ncbi:MAG: hypothetical protein LCH20_00150 [Proteobacteria bacterium]|nr:hypothetical protein [Pseudomonadota bacterium]